MKDNKNIILVFLAIALLAIIWKLAKSKPTESAYYIDGSWYVKQPWQDSWPLL
jgi:uncharacterized membrane protein YqjE